MDYKAFASRFTAESAKGRYVTLNHILPVLHEVSDKGELRIVGESVQGRPVYALKIGEGPNKILLWSQMHGNESTTTKALLDFLLFLNSNDPAATQILSQCTLLCFPMLNPDGAQAYTRENANGIDLNRDAQNLSQPESRILREHFNRFQPDYCFNLHDQRTIFGVGQSSRPATVSFLAPAYNEACEYNEVRSRAVNVIMAMERALYEVIPGQIGRFDDAFNLNCVGDTFQSLGVPTVLFEAGHFQGDYQREQTRKFILTALFVSVQHISENVIVDNEISDYLRIPQNKIVFFDIVYKNVKINYDGNIKNTNFAVQFREELIDDQVSFKAYVSEIGSLEMYHGHFEYDANGAEYRDDFGNSPKLNEKADFFLGGVRVQNGMPVSD